MVTHFATIVSRIFQELLIRIVLPLEWFAFWHSRNLKLLNISGIWFFRLYIHRNVPRKLYGTQDMLHIKHGIYWSHSVHIYLFQFLHICLSINLSRFIYDLEYIYIYIYVCVCVCVCVCVYAFYFLHICLSI